MNESLNERHQEKILQLCKKDETTGCWLWQGKISNSGYGNLMVNTGDMGTKIESAHLVSYKAFIGEIPAGMLARQHCNNRLCVNPQHLELFSIE